jgi:hypothetical protein
MSGRMDGIPRDDNTVTLTNDLQEHFVELIFAPVESAVSS